MKKIKKSEIIQRVMNASLAKYGFKYNGYKDKSWHYRNDDTNQEIVILEYRYDSSYYTFVMVGMYSIRASMLDNSEKFLGEYWLVNNSEEFEALIIKFLSLMIDKGFELFEKSIFISERDQIKMDISKLAFIHRDKVFESWMSEHPLVNISEFSHETIDEWFEIFTEEYQFYKRNSFENLSQNDIDEYVNVVVFLGKILEKFLGGVWKEYVSLDEYSFVIADMKAYKSTINLVNVVGISIDKNCLTQLKTKIEALRYGIKL